MKKIIFMPEYHCSPIWVYNENDELLDNYLPDDLNDESELTCLLKEIAREYDNLYENNEVVFEFRGFQDELSKRLFFDKVSRAIDLLVSEAGKRYEVEVKINETDY